MLIKMTDFLILSDIIFFFLIENSHLWVQISLKIVQVMAWCLLGNKPLPEPMLTNYL